LSSNEDNTAGEKPEEGEAVGFCRPPLATRFRPGRCGNPHGRPRRPRNLAAMVAEALNERVEVQIGERTRRMSRLEATARHLVENAAKGEGRAIHALVSLLKANERGAAPPPNAKRNEAADAIVMAELKRRFGALKSPEAP
jgi:Family of unknown function (DUF5681)